MQLASFCLLATALPGPSPAATDAQCTDLLQHALTARNPDTRKEAVVALSLASDRSPLLTLLIGMADDKDVPVRLAVVASLAEVKAKAVIDALHKALRDPVPEVSFAAAKALWNLHDPAGKQALLSVVQGETKTASGYITGGDAPGHAHDAYPGHYLPLRHAPGHGLRARPGAGRRDCLDAGVAGPTPASPAAPPAVLLLGKDNDPKLLPALKDALYDKNWTVRAAAVHSLALRNDPALKTELAPLIDDDKEGVRFACCRRLAPPLVHSVAYSAKAGGK